MVNMRYKPQFLPQISAPFSIVLNKLKEYNVDYESVKINPNELEPMQSITFNNEVMNAVLDNINPIWISNNNNILDGHHRMVKALILGVPISAIRIKLNDMDACRILNKIQDIYEYEQSISIEEVEQQDVINYYQDNEYDFIKELEENISSVNEKNKQIVIGYRKGPIKEKSTIGNFFVLSPIEGFDKYEIVFDNLLDTNAIGITCFINGQEPIDVLAKNWFPHIKFEEISKIYNIEPILLKNKAIVEKAKKMGYDGIKYGDKIIQGLK